MPDLKTPLLWLLGVALLAALGTVMVERTQTAKAREETSKVRAEFADYRATQAEAGRHADKAERQKERDHEDAIRRAVQLARQQVADAGAAAATAAAAGRQLRDALDIAYRSLRACPNSSPPGGGKAADATIDLLSRLQQRLDDATDRIAGFADQSRIAGRTCERIHDGISGAVKTSAPP